MLIAEDLLLLLTNDTSGQLTNGPLGLPEQTELIRLCIRRWRILGRRQRGVQNQEKYSAYPEHSASIGEVTSN